MHLPGRVGRELEATEVSRGAHAAARLVRARQKHSRARQEIARPRRAFSRTNMAAVSGDKLDLLAFQICSRRHGKYGRNHVPREDRLVDEKAAHTPSSSGWPRGSARERPNVVWRLGPVVGTVSAKRAFRTFREMLAVDDWSRSGSAGPPSACRARRPVARRPDTRGRSSYRSPRRATPTRCRRPHYETALRVAARHYLGEVFSTGVPTISRPQVRQRRHRRHVGGLAVRPQPIPADGRMILRRAIGGDGEPRRGGNMC